MPLSLALELSPYLNLALRLNDVVPIRRLTIVNDGPDALTDLRLELRSNPAQALHHDWTHLSVPAHGQLDVPLAGVHLDYDFYAQLSEGLTAHVTATLYGPEPSTAEGTLSTIDEGFAPVGVGGDTRLLPAHHWGGNAGVPELVAAHVLPNDPAVARLLRRAAELLVPTGFALSGYQKEDPRAAGAQVIAVLTAIREQDIHYVGVPSSFEEHGQKVRTPTEVVGSGLGNCLDLTALACAVLEQAELHPGIVLIKGHAYLVCWLHPSPVRGGTVRDLQMLRKAEASGLLIACESTALAGAGADVNGGIALGRQALANPEGWREMVDVHAARTGEGIHPISQAIEAGERIARQQTTVAALDLTALAAVPSALATDEAPIPRGAARVDQWKKRLLDLTRRNRLLNWKPLRSNILLPHVDPAALEDALASGTKFSFDQVDTGRGRGAKLQRELGEAHHAQAVAQAMLRGVLLVTDASTDLYGTLIKLERAARTATEEGGANTLYLALGFARKGAAEAPEYRAPLILLPVELRRRKAGNSFTLARRDEEALLNPTLQELLRREAGVTFEGLTEELPQDDSGIDIPLVLAKARSVLLNVEGWEVETGVALGEFSFAKYLMWRDLDRFERHLRENPVVAHLIERPREPYHVPGSDVALYPDREHLDETFPVAEMLTPMSADASQLAAVRAASLGIDFVLEGPPGTGKSQTITNLIAQCLGEGKSVLFVSEKTAALEVVERRLNEIGLGDFCLELHSNKVTKTHVYDQLKAAWAVAPADDAHWTDEAARLGALRAELNDQVAALHDERRAGMSVYAAVSQANHPAAATAPAPPAEWALAQDAKDLAACKTVARQLGVTLADIPVDAHADLSPLRGHFEAAAFERDARQVAAAVEAFREAHAAFAKTLDIGGQDYSRVVLEDLDVLAGLVQRARGKDFRRLAETVGSGRHRRNAIEEARLLTEIAGAFAKLKTDFRPEVSQLAAEPLRVRWRSSEQKFVLLKWWEQRGLKQELAGYSRTGEVADVAADLEALVQVEGLNRALQQLGAPAQRLEREDLAKAGEYAAFAGDWLRFVERAEAVGLTVTGAERMFRNLFDDGREGRDSVEAGRAYQGAWGALEAAEGAWVPPSSRGGEGVPPNPRGGEGLGDRLGDRAGDGVRVGGNGARFGDSRMGGDGTLGGGVVVDSWTGAPNYLEVLARVAEGLLVRQAHWRNWGLFAEARREAERLGMGYFAEALLGRASIGGERSERQFGLGFARVWAGAMIGGDPRLAGFSGSVQSDRIQRFRELDERVRVLAQAEIRSRLLARRSELYTQEMRPHLAVWNSEKEKKRRQLAVRPLIEGLGPLLTELTPCLLMSPLSVAQYLPPDRAIRFDVVVFDEASQIPVWDAVGAIARGRQVIVVGDSKQLPPTSFFEKNEADDAPAAAEDTEEGYALVEDMESILDEMQAASLQSKRLRWHYRSRAESLIAFSNRTYYEGELNTFPAPVAEDDAVEFHKVESLDYQSGKNRAEAEALVEYLVARLRDPAEGKRTFGVVTFGMAQRTVIEDMLETARARYPELDRHFDPDFDERVFVKNIENVQGDERDVILFSITYGPDRSGKVRMAFGPMNSVGGERRLNVAVTRARREMHVFASMEPEQIDLNRLGDNAQGARDLRRFLEFARRGSKAYAGGVLDAAGGADGVGLKAAIAEALRAEGHEVDLDVGVSGYRIDLAIRDPKAEGKYLLGVELDGPGYRDAATARERDILREAVLKGLGWKLERVWSLDWWYDSGKVLRRVNEAATELATEPAMVLPAESLRQSAEGSASATLLSADDQLPGGGLGGRPGRSPGAAPPPPAAGPPPVTYQPITEEELAPLTKNFARELSEVFYYTEAVPALRRMIELVLEREAPLLMEEVVKRVAGTGFGLGRMTARVRERVEPEVRRAGHVVQRGGDTVVYRDAAQVEQPITFRPPMLEAGAYSRGIADIPLVELEALARELLPLGLDGDALIREMGSRIGVARVSGSSRVRVEQAVERAWG